MHYYNGSTGFTIFSVGGRSIDFLPTLFLKALPLVFVLMRLNQWNSTAEK